MVVIELLTKVSKKFENSLHLIFFALILHGARE